MPIAFSCPRCGKQTSVSDQYAGQTGPCAACGKPITVPGGYAGAGYAYAPPPSQGGRGAIITVVVVLAAMGILVIPVLLALLLPALGTAREAARRSQSQNNMKNIALAMLNYHDTHQALPPAVVRDAAGKPLYSGRVLLLPYLEQEPLYDLWDLSQAWDSPRNRSLSQQTLKIFSDPSGSQSKPGQTDYLFVVGQGTALEGPGPTGLNAITDGMSNTLFLVDVRDSGVSWAEPRDWDVSQPIGLPQGNHPGITLGAFYDGHVTSLMKDMAPEDVRALATKAGNETVSY